MATQPWENQEAHRTDVTADFQPKPGGTCRSLQEEKKTFLSSSISLFKLTLLCGQMVLIFNNVLFNFLFNNIFNNIFHPIIFAIQTYTLVWRDGSSHWLDRASAQSAPNGWQICRSKRDVRG